VNSVQQVKRKLVDVPTVLRAHGVHVKGKMFSCILPGHVDKNPSSSIFDNKQKWRCHVCGITGDAIDAESILSGRNTAEVVRGMSIASSSTVRRPGFRTPNRPFVPELSAGEPKDYERLARLRNLQPAAVMLAAERGLLKFGKVRHFDAWIITDESGRNMQARRMDGKRWDRDGRVKAWTFPGCQASWPIGCQEASGYLGIMLVEGGPDLLAAFHFAWCENKSNRVAAVCVTGASNRIPDDCLPYFAGRAIRIFPHADQAGMKALDSWASQLRRVARNLSFFDLRGLRKCDSSAVKDLNDLAYICPDQFEERRGLWDIVP